MQETIKLIIGSIVLLLGFPLGILLSKKTREELESGQKWFGIIIIASLVGGIIGLIIGNDIVLFSFFFIAVVTSMNLRKDRITKK